MNKLALHSLASVSVLAASCFLAAAEATPVAMAFRTWVSAAGDDTNPCSRTSPCKTFAGALAKTYAGGEIVPLDSGGFGAVTIDRSITINARGVLAGALSNGATTITVDAGPSDVVYLRGLDLNGVGDNGANGIVFHSGGALHVEDTSIYGFSGHAIDFAPTGNSELYVNNTSLRNNAVGGIWVHADPSGTARGTVSNVQMAGNGRGLRVEDGSVVLVKNSLATGSDTAGFNVVSTLRPAMLTLEGTTSTTNQSGVRASGAQAFLRLNNTTVVGNAGVGLSSATGGNIISFGNNRVSGNAGGNGAPTSTEPSM